MTAQETYDKLQKEIAAILEFIKCELATDADDAGGNPCWGSCGTLGHVRQELKETLIFLLSEDDETAAGERIEAAIADAMGN